MRWFVKTSTTIKSWQVSTTDLNHDQVITGFHYRPQPRSSHGRFPLQTSTTIKSLQVSTTDLNHDQFIAGFHYLVCTDLNHDQVIAGFHYRPQPRSSHCRFPLQTSTTIKSWQVSTTDLNHDQVIAGFHYRPQPRSSHGRFPLFGVYRPQPRSSHCRFPLQTSTTFKSLQVSTIDLNHVQVIAGFHYFSCTGRLSQQSDT